MPLEIFIAWRYLKARRHGVFTLLTTLIAIGGITLGVAALIITLGVMSGFHRDIREKILGIQPHIVIVKGAPIEMSEFNALSAKIKAQKDVEEVAPFVYGQILIRRGSATTGCVMKGIDPDAEDRLVGFKKRLIEGSLPANAGDRRSVALGVELARNIGASVGDDIIVMSPSQVGVVPRMEKLRVAGIFRSGMYEYDANLAFTSIATAQSLFELDNEITGIGVRVSDWEQVGPAEKALSKSIGFPYWVRSWQSMNHNLFAALKLEKIMMFIILALIILVAAFNVISNLLLLTVEKTKEIGILSALGLQKFSIARIFFFEGIIVGMAGILLGLGLGTGVCLILGRYHFIHLPADVYYLDTLPVRMIPGDIFIVVVAALLITMVAAIYPAYQVTKLEPLEAIRYG